MLNMFIQFLMKIDWLPLFPFMHASDIRTQIRQGLYNVAQCRDMSNVDFICNNVH